MGTSQQQPPMNFNSIKVRLELAAKAATYVKPKFQFHKGTIRTREDYFQPEFQDYFNSIKVRLERTKDALVKQTLLFQFHKGTIRTHQLGSVLRTELISIP